MGELVPVCVPVTPTWLDVHVAVKCVIGEPFVGGAANFTRILPTPRVIAGCGGVPGTVAGTTSAEDAECRLVPTPLVAVTEQA
jgi:hypothetical protein